MNTIVMNLYRKYGDRCIQHGLRLNGFRCDACHLEAQLFRLFPLSVLCWLIREAKEFAFRSTFSYAEILERLVSIHNPCGSMSAKEACDNLRLASSMRSFCAQDVR